MLDPKLFRSNIDQITTMILQRGAELPQGEIEELEAKRKRLQVQVHDLQQKRNSQSKAVGIKKNQGEVADALLVELSELTQALKSLQTELKETQEALTDIYLRVPNLLHSSVPYGQNDAHNQLVRDWGDRPQFSFKPKSHHELLDRLLDLETSAKLAGSRFMVLKGGLARLHRALAQFMLDTHTGKHGYEEVYVPYLVNEKSMTASGQLPKFAEDAFKIDASSYYLIPTAEVPVANFVAQQIVEADVLPLKWVAHTPCFRREAGSYGRDTQGLIRQHQFDKVELVWVSHPKDSYEALEQLTTDAEFILQALQLPYRVMALCSGDVGFAAAKTYDLEVWLPGQEAYREISSCSNCTDFQARRMQARYRQHAKDKPEWVHTLNGSGLAVGRTLIAVLENYQDASGAIRVPDVLQPYMGVEYLAG